MSFEAGYGIRATNDCMLNIGSQQQHVHVPRILLADKEEALGEGWTALVAHYTDMDLSFPSDRLAAIQGITSLLSERHGVDYFAGVFRSHWLSHLLWQSRSPRNLPNRSDNFPTWSWLSSAGRVQFGLDTSEPWVSWVE